MKKVATTFDYIFYNTRYTFDYTRLYKQHATYATYAYRHVYILLNEIKRNDYFNCIIHQFYFIIYALLITQLNCSKVFLTCLV